MHRHLKTLTKAFGLSLFLFGSGATAATDTTPFGEQTPPPLCASDDASCIILKQEAGSSLEDIGLINFSSVIEDSRCPIDAFCFWSGRVAIELKRVLPEEAGVEKIALGLGPNLEDSWTDEVSGRTLILEQVWPERSLTNPIDEPYQLKLRVLEKDGALIEDETETNVDL